MAEIIIKLNFQEKEKTKVQHTCVLMWSQKSLSTWFNMIFMWFTDWARSSMGAPKLLANATHKNLALQKRSRSTER